MKLLVTGGAGYLGSVLIPKLLVRGHEVRVLDVGYFGMGHLRGLRPGVEIVRDDIRRAAADPAVAEPWLDGVDCVVHLAAISNDPSAELQPELTSAVNDHATRALAEAARDRGCRFLFSSSCSVYGTSQGIIHEDGATAPLTTYAVSKLDAEEHLQRLATPSWRPVILRNGTLYGYSPRMRFDLVVNVFALHSSLHDEIRIFGTGEQWRPFLHVADCARAFLHFAEMDAPAHILYNVASENLRVLDVAPLFAALNPRLRITHGGLPEDDARDYRVSWERAAADGFRPVESVARGAEQVCEAIASGIIADPESLFYRNAKWLGELSAIGGKEHGELVQFMETAARMGRGLP